MPKKLLTLVRQVGGPPIGYGFECPGCQSLHVINIIPNEPNGVGGLKPVWSFSGTLECPTIHPSIKAVCGKDVCHCYVASGKIQFLTDCTHALAGQVVDLQDVEE